MKGGRQVRIYSMPDMMKSLKEYVKSNMESNQRVFFLNNLYIYIIFHQKTYIFFYKNDLMKLSGFFFLYFDNGFFIFYRYDNGFVFFINIPFRYGFKYSNLFFKK